MPTVGTEQRQHLTLSVASRHTCLDAILYHVGDRFPHFDETIGELHLTECFTMFAGPANPIIRRIASLPVGPVQ